LVEELRSRIEARGFICELYTQLEPMSKRAFELVGTNHLRTVVAAGGDGTAATVASLIPEKTPLTLFPVGSENLLARYLSVQADPEQCASLIEGMSIKTMDAMMVNGKLTLLMASVGFDAEVVRRVHSSRRSHITRWTYWKSIISTLATYRWRDIQLDVLDGQDRLVQRHIGNWVFVFNVPRYAAGLRIIDDARDDDGQLDIGIFGSGGMVAGIRNYLAVLSRSHKKSSDWVRLNATSVRITSGNDNSPALTCQTDGDWASDLPITIHSLPHRIRVLVNPKA